MGSIYSQITTETLEIPSSRAAKREFDKHLNSAAYILMQLLHAEKGVDENDFAELKKINTQLMLRF
jgi:hypothetical protein